MSSKSTGRMTSCPSVLFGSRSLKISVQFQLFSMLEYSTSSLEVILKEIGSLMAF